MSETLIGTHVLGNGASAQVFSETRAGAVMYFLRFLGPDGRIVTTVPTPNKPRVDVPAESEVAR